jgi:hypothetical protein
MADLSEIPRVKNVKVLENYILEIDFDNGEHGHFSMLPYLDYPVYQILKDYSVFSKARASMGLVSWNGDIEIDPDRLYLECQMLA